MTEIRVNQRRMFNDLARILFGNEEDFKDFEIFEGDFRIDLISKCGTMGYILFIGDPLSEDNSGRQKLFLFNRYLDTIKKSGARIIKSARYGQNPFGICGVYWRNEILEEAA